MASDPTTEEGVKKQEDEAKRLRLNELSDLKKVLNLPAGSRFLRRLMTGCFMYTTTYDKSNSKFAQNEGRRTLMLQLTEDMAELVVRRMIKPVELLPFVINLPDEEEE